MGRIHDREIAVRFDPGSVYGDDVVGQNPRIVSGEFKVDAPVVAIQDGKFPLVLPSCSVEDFRFQFEVFRESDKLVWNKLILHKYVGVRGGELHTNTFRCLVDGFVSVTLSSKSLKSIFPDAEKMILKKIKDGWSLGESRIGNFPVIRPKSIIEHTILAGAIGTVARTRDELYFKISTGSLLEVVQEWEFPDFPPSYRKVRLYITDHKQFTYLAVIGDGDGPFLIGRFNRK